MAQDAGPRGDVSPEPAPPPAAAAPTVTATTPVATLDCSALLAKTEPAPSVLAQLGASQLEKLGAFEPGPLGELLISEIVQEVCESAEVKAALRSTCSAPPAPDVRQLRARLIADAAHAVADQAAALSRSAGVSPESTQALLIGAALQALIETPSARGLAQQLLRSAPWTLRQDCRISGDAADQYRDLQVTAVLILQLEQRLEGEARSLADQELEALVLKALVAAGKHAEGQALSELQREALRTLVDDLARARELTPASLDAAGYARLASMYAAVLAHGLSLASDKPVAVPTEVAGIASALAAGDVVAVLDQASARVLGASGGRAVEALLFGMRVVRAKSEEEARGMLARAALGLGPWSDRIIVGLNVGVPRLDFDDFKIAGDAKLGYNAPRWGIVAKGFLSAYDLSSSVLVADNFLAGGSGDVWVTFNPEGHVKGELRADLGGNLYDTESIPIGMPGANLFSDETSIMLRGAALAGLRVEYSQAALGLWLGGGGEYEQYNQTTVAAAGSTRIEDLENGHLMLNGRLRAQFPIVSKILVGRVRADVLRHSITRESVTTDIAMRTTMTGDTSSSVQLEASARAFLDLEIGKFFGFVPAIEGGLDYFALSDDNGDVSTSVPILGVGIRRTEF